ncbi:MAG: STAS domain-containing protein [Leptospiraceae bacterium]|nr:STAS domain-containing protein [Leptospiraceae bacterium]
MDIDNILVETKESKKYFQVELIEDKFLLKFINMHELDLYHFHLSYFLNENCKKLDNDWILDFSNITFIDSTGLSILISTQKILDAKSKILFIQNCKTEVKRFFDETHSANLFKFI